MRFRTKLLLLFLAVALGSNALGMALMYSLSKRFLFNQFQSKVQTVSATTAALLDGDLHRAIRTREDEGSPAYLKLKEQLRRARDANRRADIFVKYLLTFKPAAQGGDDVEFGVDPEENPRDVSHAGDLYRSSKGAPIHLDASAVDDTIAEDQWGRWIGSTSPLRDGAGKIVGAVAADVSSDELEHVLQPLRWSAFGALGLSALLALGATVFLSDRVNRPVHELLQAVNRVGKGDFSTQVHNASRDEFGDLSRAVNVMAAGLRERDNVKSAFARYVSHQVFDSITSDGKLPALHGDRRKITVMFCDVRGFTKMSEHMRPEAVVEMLNQYFERVVDIVVRNEGIIDKFIGDGVMIVFGAPKEDPYQEEHALKAAIEIRAALLTLRSEREKQGLPSISVGIGINSGVAVVGNMGASARMEYTAIGDTVNLASRLESATRELNVDILLSEYTYTALRGSYKMNKVGPISVKGRDEPVVTYTVELTDPV